MNERLCAWCGKPFQARYRNKKYCCEYHAKAAWRKANPERWRAIQQSAQQEWMRKQQAHPAAWKAVKSAYNRKYYEKQK